MVTGEPLSPGWVYWLILPGAHWNALCDCGATPAPPSSGIGAPEAGAALIAAAVAGSLVSLISADGGASLPAEGAGPAPDEPPEPPLMAAAILALYGAHGLNP